MSTLAFKGGAPSVVLQKNWPVYDEREQAALERVLALGQWGTLGEEALRFADRFAAYCGCSRGISVTNGTVSLEIILRGLNIGWGDEVIVPAYTFYSTISAVAMAGACPVPADAEAATGNLDPESLDRLYTPAVKAVIVTHIGGRPASMDRIGAFCREKGLFLIEDAAHAHGSEWEGKRAGSLGDAASFSFQSSKNLTCGEGGLISTNREKLFEEFWHYHHAGRCFEGASEFGGEVLLGTNARMAEWEAAVLNVQLDRLDGQIARRESNARLLENLLGDVPYLRTPPEDSRITRNSYHLLLLQYCSCELGGLHRDRFVEALCAEGVPVSTGYNPIHQMPVLRSDSFYRATGRRIDGESLSLPNTERLCLESGVWLPGWVLLGSEEEMERIAGAVKKVGAAFEELL